MGASKSNPLIPAFFPLGTFLLVIANIILYPILKQDYFFQFDVFAQAPLEHWRQLLGCMFSHGNIAHLLGNMMFLLFAGPKIEKNLGTYKHVFLYCVAGLGASLGFGLVFPDAQSLGASGAISGLMVVYPFVQRTFTGFALTGLAVGFYFLRNFMDAVHMIEGYSNGVASLAHVAGGVTALLVFAFFKRKSI